MGKVCHFSLDQSENGDDFFFYIFLCACLFKGERTEKKVLHFNEKKNLLEP